MLLIYEQTLFNFSSIQLDQHNHFLYNPFFIHPAIRNFETIKQNKLSSSKQQLWLFDTFSTKKSSQIAWFHSTSIFQRLYFYFLLECLDVMLFMESQYSTFHGTSNRGAYRTVQWNSSGPVIHLKIDVFLIHL